MHDIACHGTYIHGDRRWKFLRRMTLEEVVKRLSISDEQRPGKDRPCTLCKGENPAKKICGACDGSGKSDEYLWLNKGYIVVELHPCQNSFRHNDIRIGMQAIYLGDGRYALYEYTATGFDP